MERTIFIVEDNEGVALRLRELCRDLGVQYSQARGSTEAIGMLTGWSQAGKALPDIAIIDVVLHEGDGFKVASAIRGRRPGRMSRSS